MNDGKGLLVVISGPSGSGKGTVVNQLFSLSDKFAYSVSCTSRAPRENEVNGTHYHFITKEQFESQIESGEIIEYTEYCGNYYGTPKVAVNEMLDRGINVVLEIEVDGAMQIKNKFPERSVLIMLIPPDYKTLEDRLRSRGTNTEDDIIRRLERAKKEMTYFTQYDYVVVNKTGHVDEAAKAIIGIVSSEYYSTKRNINLYNNFSK